MTRYYFNENPQVTYLLEKIEEQEKRIKELEKKVEIANEMCDECVRFAENFNKLSWLKKIFLRFDI